MLTQKQKEILDSLVSEFTKMNAPKNDGKKGLLDWDEIYSEKREWENTKMEIEIKNKAMIESASIEVDRITELLNDEFDLHFYLHQPSKETDIQYCWRWYLCPYGKSYRDSVIRIELRYKKEYRYSPCKSQYVQEITSWNFECNDLLFNTIEDIFKDKSVITTIKSHINK